MDCEEVCGGSLVEPKSLALVCLLSQISWTDGMKIVDAFRSLAQEDFSHVSDKAVISYFFARICEISPQAEDLSDLMTFAFIRIIGKKYIPELYPLSCRLQPRFLPPLQLEDAAALAL